MKKRMILVGIFVAILGIGVGFAASQIVLPKPVNDLIISVPPTPTIAGRLHVDSYNVTDEEESLDGTMIRAFVRMDVKDINLILNTTSDMAVTLSGFMIDGKLALPIECKMSEKSACIKDAITQYRNDIESIDISGIQQEPVFKKSDLDVKVMIGGI